eukprot:gene3090-3378_t
MCECDLKIGINGFGRIGRLFARQIWLKKKANIVAINDPLLDNHAIVYLLKYDSIHGRFPIEVQVDGNDAIRVGDCRIPVFKFKDANEIPWGDLEVEYVAETSGHYLTGELAAGHLRAGAKKVVLSAPPKDDNIPTFVLGVNESCYNSSMEIVSNASCTTNCMAPLVKLIHDNYGIEEGLMSTIHAVTATQTVVDTASKRDYRAGRCAGRNIIPATTGAAAAVVKTIPELEGKITGLAFRVPVENVSVLDLTLKLSKPLNDLQELSHTICEIEKDKNHPLHGIVGATSDPVVSSDFNGDEHSCIVDITASIVLNPNFVKLVAYYDNEWGYAARLVDFILFACKKDHEESSQGKSKA